MTTLARATRRSFAGVAAAGVLALIAGSSAAAAVATGPGPVIDPPATSVTADALPTVQVDGVVWSQATVGTTVYAGGSFANARPAGAASGTNLTPRGNLLAFDITTGVLAPKFAPVLNAQVNAVAASPDGSRVYVGGQFTTADGAKRYRLAAYDTATGTLVAKFAPYLNASVNALVATNSTVYVGGGFTVAGTNTSASSARSRLAAFNASDGALLPWAPSADNAAQALELTPSGSKVVIGGNFTTLNGQPAYGLAAVDATSGATLPWAIASIVRNSGANAGITDLSITGSTIYGSGYVFGGGSGNLEGTFAADAETGNVVWISGCHGDSYGIYGTTSAVYVASHSYYCAEIGGFPYSSTTANGAYHRATAFTPQATGSAQGGAFNGVASPSLINWFPDFTAGTATGQAAWDVTGAAGYVSFGGDFPKVNNVAQQGLVRFAARPAAPGLQGPRLSGSTFPLTTSVAGTAVTVSWQPNWDRDDTQLTYKLVRDGNVKNPIYASPATFSTFWTYQGAAPLTFTDTAVSPGTHTYKVIASDPSGNSATSAVVSVMVPTPPATLFGSAVPTVGAIGGGTTFTLGTTFSTSTAGSVTGIRFWKGDGNTGTHTVTLWAADGTTLATATVSGETASGWQTALFASPVTVSPGATYIAAYLCPNGHYAQDTHYFDNPVVRAPLSAPVGAGVFAWGDAYPGSSWLNTNYWVDPLFVAN